MKATLNDLITALTANMSTAEILETSINIEISRAIRNARKELQWTQNDFAKKMGVTQSLISRWESGDCNYTIGTLAQISTTLGLTMQCPLTPDKISIKVPAITTDEAEQSVTVSRHPGFSKTIRFDMGASKNMPEGGAA